MNQELDIRYDEYFKKLDALKKSVDRRIYFAKLINERREAQQKMSDFENRLLATGKSVIRSDCVYNKLIGISSIFETKKHEHGYGTTNNYYVAAAVTLNLLKRFEKRQINEEQYKFLSEISFYDLRDLIYEDSKNEYRKVVYCDEYGYPHEEDKEGFAAKKVLEKYGFNEGAVN